MPTVALAISYRVNAQDGPRFQAFLGDLSLPAATITVSLRYAGTSSIDITIPGLELLSEIQARSKRSLAVHADGSMLLRSPLTRIDFSESTSSAQVTLTASGFKPFGGGKAVDVANIFERSTANGIRSLAAGLNVNVRPGRNIVTTVDSFRVGSVVFNLTTNNATMSVEELTEGDIVRRDSGEQVFIRSSPFMQIRSGQNDGVNTTSLSF